MPEIGPLVANALRRVAVAVDAANLVLVERVGAARAVEPERELVGGIAGQRAQHHLKGERVVLVTACFVVGVLLILLVVIVVVEQELATVNVDALAKGEQLLVDGQLGHPMHGEQPHGLA